MKTTLFPIGRVARMLALAGLATTAGQAGAYDVYLCAKPVDLAVPGGTVPMWGFAPDNAAGDCAQPATVPGPAIEVPANDPTLTVYLKNALATPVSFVVNGQAMPAATGAEPVWTDNSTGPRTAPGQRVRSFVHETAPGAIGTYRFGAIKPGSYLYQSGSHPQIQVQMGLYGALAKNAVDAVAPGLAQAYADVPYNRAVTLLYSEIDPALHAQVVGGLYDPNLNSTLNYQPKYFLINGKAFVGSAPPLARLRAGNKTLLRFLNAGLQTHVPVIANANLRMIAEDGNPYPWPANPREQYSVLLPAAKTIDALFTPQFGAGGTANRYAIYDRRLSLGDGAGQDGGMLAYLDVAATGGTAPSIDSTPVTGAAQGEAYGYAVVASDADGGALVYAFDRFPAGMSIGAGSGAIAWTPTAQQVGTQAVTVRVTDPTGLSATQSFNIAVANRNDPPVATSDDYSVIMNGAGGVTLDVAAPGLLANDTDVDAGDILTAVNFIPPADGTLTANADGSFRYTATTAGNKTFTYRARDSQGAMSTRVVATVHVIANRAPLAGDDAYAAAVRTGPVANYAAVSMAILTNDSDPDTAIDPSNVVNPASIRIVAAPNMGGRALVNPNGTIAYTPALGFHGSEVFKYRVRDNLGRASNIATVQVNVQ